MTELSLFASPLDVLPFQVAIGTTARTVATEFSITSGSWWLSEMRLWRNSWELAGPLQFRIYTVVSASEGTTLAGSDATVRVAGLGWQVARLATPVKLTTGQVYRVCCWAPRGVNYQAGYWASGVTNGALSAPSRAASVGVTQGAYLVGTSLAYPTTDGGSVNWYVDVTVTDVDPASVMPALTAALAAAEHQPLVSLQADWARDGYGHPLSDVSRAVAELTVNRSVTGDLPVEAGLVEGYAAAQLTATLHGALTEEIAPTGLPPAAPVFVAEYESAWTNATSPKSVSVTTAVGDRLVVIAATADSEATLETPVGGTGLTWVLQRSIVSTQYCAAYIWTSSPVTAVETFSLSITRNGSAGWFWGFNVLRWSGSAGIGPYPASVLASGPPSLSITTIGNKSAVVVLNADWNVGTDTRVWRTTAGALTELTYSTSGGQITVYGGYHADVGAAGVKNVGLTAPTVQKYSLLAIEILGISGESGAAIDALDALAPYRTDSPLAAVTLEGAPLTCDLGLATDGGPVMARQFTGRVRSIRADSGTRQISLSSLDPAEQLRASITLPVHGLSRPDLPWSIRPQAVIDYILRANGIYASPLAFPDAQICCTGHGWMVAEIGATTIPDSGTSTVLNPPFWVPGPFDMLAVRGNWSSPVRQRFYARGINYSPVAGSGVGVCAWVRVGNDLGQTASTYKALVQLSVMALGNGPPLEVRIYGDGRLGGYIGPAALGFRSIPTPMRWRYIGVHFAHLASGDTRISFRVDGSTTTVDVITPTYTGDYAPYLEAIVESAVDWSNLSVWFAPTAPTVWTGETHVSQASLDMGRNELTHLPDITGADSWNLIQDIAGAELGIVGFDESGMFYFRERTDPTLTTNAQTLTADRELIAVAAVSDIDSLRNVITTKVSPATLADRGNLVTIFQADRVDQFDSLIGITDYYVLVPWGATGSFLDRGEVPRWAVSSWNDDVTEGYVPVLADNPTSELPNFTIKVWWSILPGGRFGKLTVDNSSVYNSRFALPGTSEPALRVSGYQLVPAPTQTVQATDAASISTHGPRVLTLPESSWRQLPVPMQELTTELVGTLAISRAVFEVSALGDPRRKVGDTVIISDPGGQGVITGLVVSITRRYSDRGLIDDLTVRSAT